MSETDDIQEPDVPKISRRRKRCAEYYFVENCTKAEAYRRTFPVKPEWDAQRIADNAYRVFNHPQVKAYLAYLARQAEDEYDIKKHVVLSKLYAAATANVRDLYDEQGNLIPLRDLPPHVAATLSSVKVEELYSGRGEGRAPIGVLKEVKQINSNEAADVLGKMLGWQKGKLDIDLNAPPPVINIAPYPDADEAEAEARAAVSRHTTAT